MTQPRPRKSTKDLVAQSSEDPRDEGRARPEAIVEFLFDRGLFYICVRNIGNRPAINVSVKFDKTFLGQGGTKEISALPLFKRIAFLGPQREITTFLDSSSSYFRSEQPTRIAATISYTDPEKRKYEATINHDLEIYRGLAYMIPTSTQPDTDSLEKGGAENATTRGSLQKLSISNRD